MYRLDLPSRIKIYPVQHIAILEPVHRNPKPLIYKLDTYRGYKKDKQPVKKILVYKEQEGQLFYKV